MQLSTLIFALVVLSTASAAKIKLNKVTPVCSRSDPNLNDCVAKSAKEFVGAMVKGIRDYGIPPIDPLKIPFLELSEAEKSIGMKLNISDTVHDGMSAAVIKSANIDVNKNHFEIAVYIPRYSITGVCDVGGKILLLPITGHGPCNLTGTHMDMKMTIDGKLETRKGKEYMKMTSLKVNLISAKGIFKLSGLFGGNKELGETMNRFLNENAQEVLNEMRSTLEDVWADIFRGLVERLFNSVPYDEVFAP